MAIVVKEMIDCSKILRNIYRLRGLKRNSLRKMIHILNDIVNKRGMRDISDFNTKFSDYMTFEIDFLKSNSNQIDELKKIIAISNGFISSKISMRKSGVDVIFNRILYKKLGAKSNKTSALKNILNKEINDSKTNASTITGISTNTIQNFLSDEDEYFTTNASGVKNLQINFQRSGSVTDKIYFASNLIPLLEKLERTYIKKHELNEYRRLAKLIRALDSLVLALDKHAIKILSALLNMHVLDIGNISVTGGDIDQLVAAPQVIFPY